MRHESLYEALSKLRIMAAVLYDQGTAAGLSEEEKQESIAPLRHRREEIIKLMIQKDLSEVIIAIKDYQEEAACDMRRAKRHQEKAQEAQGHAQVMLDLLKQDMISKGKMERIHGNYMAVITDGKLEIR